MATSKLGFLGPQGTFSEEAALLYCNTFKRELCEYPTISAVIAAVIDGSLDEGIVPLENTLEGGITTTLDQLAHQDGALIRHELIHRIQHCLMAASQIALPDIRQVCSHPQALGQCAAYLGEKLPNATSLPAESTAAAAKYAAGKIFTAAIAARRAADLFGLTLLAEGIEDNEENATRFVVLARDDHPPTGNDKTSLVLSIPDGPGSLYQVLGSLAERNINMTRIESRPSRRIIGDWLFFIDCEGHRSDPALRELWTELNSRVPFLKLLGSYPQNSRPC